MIKNIEICNFKRHKEKSLQLGDKVTLIHGDNGSGKTSVLEAISLFAPGKGIFNLNNNELIRKGEDFFSVKIATHDTSFQIKYQNKKKDVLISNTQSSSRNLLEHISVLGLTPYQSLAFWQDIALRRKIINRVVLQHSAPYGNYYNQYTKALKHKNLLISNGTFNKKWQNFLDPIIRHNGLKINEIRKNVIQKIFANIPREIRNFLNGDIKLIISPTFQEQEEILNAPLSENFAGPHLSKFFVIAKNELSMSTGQQRKALLAMLLASFSADEYKNNILLLDDVLANLDQQTIKELISLLSKQKIQIIITHVEKIKHPSIHAIELTL